MYILTVGEFVAMAPTITQSLTPLAWPATLPLQSRFKNKQFLRKSKQLEQRTSHQSTEIYERTPKSKEYCIIRTNLMSNNFCFTMVKQC